MLVIFSDTRYTIWYRNEQQHRPSALLKRSEGMVTIDLKELRTNRIGSTLHHVGSDTDPASPDAVWINHVFIRADQKYRHFIARIQP